MNYRLQLPDRILVNKIANKIRDHVSQERDWGVLEEWDGAIGIGDEMAKAVWFTLTTPQRQKITELQRKRYGIDNGTLGTDYHGRLGRQKASGQ